MKVAGRLQSAASSLALILVVALAARALYFWYRQDVTSHQVLSTVSFLYEPGNIAYSLATGGGFSSPFRVPTGPTAWQAPVYPLLLAGLFRVFGTYTYSAFVAAVWFNILCSVFACVPLYYSGTRIAGRGAGVLAAWFWALFPNAFVIPTDWIWDTCLSALLTAVILWATLNVADSRRVRDWCGYGLLWGFTLMTNPTLLSVLPLLFGWFAYREWKRNASLASAGSFLRRVALSIALMAACCVPWTVRNYVVFHSFIPFRSVLGLQLWLGNNDAYKDHFPGQLHPLDNSAERARYVQLGEVAYMREKLDMALEWIVSHPGPFARISWQRFVATWAGTDTPWRDFRSSSSVLIRFVFLANAGAAIACLSGILVLFARRNPFVFPASVFPVIYPFAFYFSQALLRYRHPVDPVVLLLSAAAIATVFRRQKNHLGVSLAAAES